MASAALCYLLVLLFIAIFAMLAYRFMGGIYSVDSQPRPPLPPMNDDTVDVRSDGLDPVIVRALPMLLYAGAKEAGGCAICLGEFEADRVKVIPGCGHVFHPKCIDEWLVLHGSCPICRCSDVLGENVGVVAPGAVHVDLNGGANEEREEEERKLVGLERSKSFSCCSTEESKISLQPTCSV